MLVLLCYGNNKAQVGRDEFVFGTFAFRSALFNLLGKFYFFIYRYEWSATYLNKILVESLARAVGYALLNL